MLEIRVAQPMPELEIALRIVRLRLRGALALLAMLTATIQTGCSTVTAQAPVDVEIEPPTYVMPERPVMPEGLPAVCLWPSGRPDEIPRDYHCDPERDPRPRDLVVDPDRWDALRLHLDLWGEYPGQVSEMVDALNVDWRAAVANAARVAAAKEIARRLRVAEDGSAWGAWDYLAVLGVGAAGIVLGALVTALAVAF
jgi:hypothetical protein